MKSGCSLCVPKSPDLSDGSEFSLGAVFSQAAGAPPVSGGQETFSSAVTAPKSPALKPRPALDEAGLFIELLREGERSSQQEGLLYCLLAAALFLLVAIGLM